MVAIIDADGNTKVEYTYDAWGKILSISGPMADTLGAVNPLTYRGYVYDTETDLYYLQSRYYDPAVERFINADALVSTGQGLLGNNMFAYCLNNPVARIDQDGYAGLWYYLMVDSDWGFVHRMVQLHIVFFSGLSVKSEVTIEGRGRADIVDKKNGAVWEIKHASTNAQGRAMEAKLQATKYLGGKYQGGQITCLGDAGRFSGSFILLCLGSDTDKLFYKVKYWTPQNGVILYSVEEVPKCDLKLFAVFIYSQYEVKEEDIPFPATAAFGLLSGLAGGHAASGTLEDIYCDMAYNY